MVDLDCQDFIELVTAYFDDALDADTRRRFEEHVAICAGCQTYLDQLRLTVDLLGTLPADQLSDHAFTTLREAFRDWSATMGQ